MLEHMLLVRFTDGQVHPALPLHALLDALSTTNADAKVAIAERRVSYCHC